MIVFRQADPRYPFLWESPDQPAGRWHGPGEGPAHYFSDTPVGAWAELLRHEDHGSRISRRSADPVGSRGRQPRPPNRVATFS